MKILLCILIIVLLGLQYRLWIGEGSVASVHRLHQEINAQRTENEQLQQRNQLLSAEVFALKEGTEAIEERARVDLGMIKKGETFFMVVAPGSEKAIAR
jgi:cell division protein FtsB